MPMGSAWSRSAPSSSSWIPCSRALRVRGFVSPTTRWRAWRRSSRSRGGRRWRDEAPTTVRRPVTQIVEPARPIDSQQASGGLRHSQAPSRPAHSPLLCSIGVRIDLGGTPAGADTTVVDTSSRHLCSGSARTTAPRRQTRSRPRSTTTGEQADTPALRLGSHCWCIRLPRRALSRLVESLRSGHEASDLDDSRHAGCSVAERAVSSLATTAGTSGRCARDSAPQRRSCRRRSRSHLADHSVGRTGPSAICVTCRREFPRMVEPSRPSRMGRLTQKGV